MEQDYQSALQVLPCLHDNKNIPPVQKTISSQKIFEGKIINVRQDVVLFPDGREASREVVEHPGGAAVLAITENGEAYFVIQYRHPVAERLLEIPAGKLDPGEHPSDCAARELAEETGVRAKELRLMSVIYSTPGFTSEKLYLYLGTGLELTERQIQEDENLEICLLPLTKAIDMAKRGEIKDGKTMVALLLAADATAWSSFA